MKENKARVALFLTALFWGFGFIFMQNGLDEIEPFNLLAVRFIISAFIIFVIYHRKIIPKLKENLSNGIFIGFVLFLGFTFQTIGLLYTTPAMNAFLTATNVIFVPFIMMFWYKKNVDKYTLIGAVIMLLGIGFLTIEPGTGIVLNKGDVLTMISGFFFAVHIVLIGKIINDSNFETIVFLQLFVTGIVSLVTSLFIENFTFTFSPELIQTFFFMIIFSTCITFYLQNYGIKKVAPSESAIILSLESLFGAMASIYFGFDVLSGLFIIGVMLIISSIILVETK